MRVLFISIAAFVIFGCAGSNTSSSTKTNTKTIHPELYYDLRQPFYLVVDESFYVGCDQALANETACRALRLQHIKEGVNQWLDYFDDSNRPQGVFFPSTENPPANRVNKTIHVGMQSIICGKAALACWFANKEAPKIVFAARRWIIPRIMAHEFGHVLGRGDNDVANGVSSIMSYNTQKKVEPLDFEMMCNMHPECKTMKRKK